jgi:dTDP-4-amino-4,6-dideoxygalactose transaminase
MRVPYVDLAEQNGRLRAELLEAFDRVLSHGQLVLGPEVAELETRLAAKLDVPAVVCVASGIDALELALRLRGIGPGDEVLVPSHTFFATAYAVELVGARPVFVDVEPLRLLMDPESAAQAIGERTRAIIPVHLGGHPCEMGAIVALAEEHGLWVIEDCAQSIGSRYRGRPTGSWGVGCFSLHPLKTLSALGDAGFLTVAEPADVEALKRLRNLGLVDRDHTEEVSSHSRLDTLQAAALLVKLEHLDEYVEARRAHARAYDDALRDEFSIVPVPDHVEPSYSCYVVRHPERDRILTAMRSRGYDLKVHYPVPIHMQRPYLGSGSWVLPQTERAVSEILSLPVSPELSPTVRDELIADLLDTCRGAGA